MQSLPQHKVVGFTFQNLLKYFPPITLESPTPDCVIVWFCHFTQHLPGNHNNLWYVPIYENTTICIYNLQSSPLPSSWQKWTFTISDKVTKKMNLEVTFLLLPEFFQNESQQKGTCPAHFNSTPYSLHKYCKSSFNRNSGEHLAPDTHFTAACWKGPSSLSWISSYFFLVILDTAQHSVTARSYFKMHVTSY